jgi:hypothetical protein
MAAINMNDIEKEVAQLAVTIFAGFSQVAINDGKALATAIQQDLLTAAEARALGEMTELDFEVEKKDLLAEAEMEKLKQEGLAQVSIDKFTAGVIDIVAKAALAAVG